MRNILIAIFSVFFLNIAFAVKLPQPAVIKMQDKDIVLPGIDDARTPKVYIFKNTVNRSLWLDHPTNRRGASAGWSSYLRPGNWSALLVDKKKFVITCSVIEPGKVTHLDCSHSVAVYAPAKVEVSSKSKGTYWLVEDKSWEELLKILEKRGIQVGKNSQKNQKVVEKL